MFDSKICKKNLLQLHRSYTTLYMDVFTTNFFPNQNIYCFTRRIVFTDHSDSCVLLALVKVYDQEQCTDVCHPLHQVLPPKVVPLGREQLEDLQQPTTTSRKMHITEYLQLQPTTASWKIHNIIDDLHQQPTTMSWKIHNMTENLQQQQHHWRSTTSQNIYINNQQQHHGRSTATW